jgi:hypothetical protein
MRQKPPFGRSRIGRFAIEAFSFVLDGNQNFAVQAATANYVNLLLRIFVIAVDDRVLESFVYGGFNVIFSLVCRAGLAHEELHELHESVDKRRDRRGMAGKGVTQFNKGSGN